MKSSKPNRRLANAALASAMVAAVVTGPVAAQSYPDKAITVVVPFAAGGTADLVGRIMAKELGARVGQTVIVENKPGSGGAIGTAEVKNAAPDGYTIMLGTIATHALNASVYPDLPYDPVADFKPVIEFGSVPYFLVVNSRLGPKTFDEFVTYAKAQERPLTYGSAGVGTANHLSGAFLASAEGFQALHVPYRGGAEAITALLGGETAYMFYPHLPLLSHIKAGTLLPLAVTSGDRVSSLPDVPTLKELGVKDFELSGWFGVYAPAGTPDDIVAKLQSELSAIIKTDNVRESLVAQGVDPVSGSSEDLANLMKADIERWRPVVEAVGARQK
jgi:tripartite-type tricarboxylate transporter receptor subunit TctC